MDRDPSSAAGGRSRSPARGDGDPWPAVAALPWSAGSRLPRSTAGVGSGPRPSGRSGGTRAPDRARRLDERQLRGARLPGLSHLSTAPGGRTGTSRPVSGSGRSPTPDSREVVLTVEARVAIHVVHRIGALVTVLYLGGLCTVVMWRAGPDRGPRRGDPLRSRATRRPGGARRRERLARIAARGSRRP